MKKIGFLGASVTAQNTARETGEMTGYVEAFRQLHASNLGFEEVIVYAYPGNRLADAGLIFTQEMLRRKPDVVVLELTIEDRSRGNDFDERHLIHITRSFIETGAKVVFFALPKVDHDDPQEALAFEKIRLFSKKSNLSLCSVYLPPGSERTDYFRDGVHTNLKGALFYADGLAKFFIEINLNRKNKESTGIIYSEMDFIVKKFDKIRQYLRSLKAHNNFRFKIQSIGLSNLGDFRTIHIRNTSPRKAGGSILIIQKQEIGIHSPVIDVEIQMSSGRQQHYQTSIWDPYCHYSRLSFVTLFDLEHHHFESITIRVSTTLPDYATCKREHVENSASSELCMRSNQPFWIISESVVDLSIETSGR